MSQHRQKQNEIKRDNLGHHTVFTKSFSFAKARFWLPRRCDRLPASQPAKQHDVADTVNTCAANTELEHGRIRSHVDLAQPGDASP